MAGVKKVPLRKCVGCQEMKSKKELLRVLRCEDGSVRLDKTGRMNGRGAYLCSREECFERAVKTRGLERSLGVHISPDMYETLKEELAKSDDK